MIAHRKESEIRCTPEPSVPAATAETPQITVLLPAMNEAENVSLVVPLLHETLRSLGLAYEILVVDGQSEDETPVRAASLGARVHVQRELGYGRALTEGFALARGRFILTMDCDYSHDPAFIGDLWKSRHRGAIVVASRYAQGGSSEAGAFRSLLSRILNATYRRILTLPVRDVSSGFRLYDRRALAEVKVESHNFDALEEILIKAYGLGYGVAEIPFRYRARASGSSKARILKFGWQLLKTLHRLWSLRNSAAWADYDYRAFDSRVFLQRYWQRTRHRLILELLSRPFGRVLDIGCGSSRIPMSIPGCVALDVQKQKTRFQSSHGVEAVGGSIYALPFRDASFDQVIFSQVIEHIPLKPQIMGELRRVLKPGGTLVIGTPDYGRMFWVILEEFYNRISPAGHCHEHITKFSLRTFRELIEGAGFRCRRARYVGGGELIIKATRG